MEIASVISAGIAILVVGFNCAMFVVLKFNDMHHLSKDVAEMKLDIKTLIKKETRNEMAIGKITARCQERHGRGLRRAYRGK